jgi:hypothetical protein
MPQVVWLAADEESETRSEFPDTRLDARSTCTHSMSNQPTLPVAPVRADDEDKKGKKKDNEGGTAPGTKSKPDEEETELSEEDQQLQNELEMLVERLKEPNTSLYAPALESLRTLIRTSTSSMTSVPKPLKFLRPHYPDLQALYETWKPSSDKVQQPNSLYSRINAFAVVICRYPLMSGYDLL